MQQPPPSGEAVLLRELFEEYGRMVFVICRALLGNRQEAEDAAQQTYLAAYQALITGSSPRHRAAWLATIARNECRARLTRAAVLSATRIEPDEPVVTDQVDFIAVKSMLADLPQRQREVVALHCLYGLTYREVAAELDLSRRAVDGLLSRARRRLRRLLGDSYRIGGILIPDVLRERLAQVVPGFEHGGATAAALPPLVSAPVAAKVAVAAAGVAVLGSAGAGVGDNPARVSEPAPRHAVRAPRVERTAPVSLPRVVDTRSAPVEAPVQVAPRRTRERGDAGPPRPRHADSSGPGSGGPTRAEPEPRVDSSGPGNGDTEEGTATSAPIPRTDNAGPGSASSGRSGSGHSGSGSSGSGTSESSSSETSGSSSSGSGSSGSGSSGSGSSGSESSGSGSLGSGSLGSASSGSGSSGSGSSGSGSSG